MTRLTSRRAFLFDSVAKPVVTRPLGKTGLTVSTLGFGCMTTSDPAVIERAADMGINLFDTARGYQGGGFVTQDFTPLDRRPGR